MATPTALATQLEARLIPVAAIRRNPANPRKRFDPAKLAELIASVEARGVLQPILVRPAPRPSPADKGEGDGEYQLVAGERRWKAAQAAGLAAVPAVIRELDDEAAFEISTIENSHREDVNPLDEAASFAAWFKRTKSPGARAIEELAAKIGHPPAYVRRRMQLNELAAPGRKLLLEGALALGPALLLARLPAMAQAKVLAGLRQAGEGLDARSLQRLIAVHSAELFRAPFDKAGCADCPSNGGAQTDLYGEVERLEGCCLRPECYGKKIKEWEQAEKARLMAAGIEVREGARANSLTTDYTRKTLHLGAHTGNPPRPECATCARRAAVIGPSHDYDGDGRDVWTRIYCLDGKCYSRGRGGKEEEAGDESADFSPATDPVALREELRHRAAEFAAAWLARTLAFDGSLWPSDPSKSCAILARELIVRGRQIFSSSPARAWLCDLVGAGRPLKELAGGRTAEPLTQGLTALDAFDAAVGDPRFPWPPLARPTAADGFPLSHAFLDTHRKGALELIAGQLGVEVKSSARRGEVLAAILAAKLPPGTLTRELAAAFGVAAPKARPSKKARRSTTGAEEKR